jgi:hypothetical protein
MSVPLLTELITVNCENNNLEEQEGSPVLDGGRRKETKFATSFCCLWTR